VLFRLVGGFQGLSDMLLETQVLVHDGLMGDDSDGVTGVGGHERA